MAIFNSDRFKLFDFCISKKWIINQAKNKFPINKAILFMFLFLHIACDKKLIPADHALIKEIKSLKTLEAKKQYLLKISADDQKVRGSEDTELMLKYGVNSKEHLVYVNAMIKMDSLNLQKIEKYLLLHGHPNKEFDSEAVNTPWMVIHHAQGYEAREQNFEIIYAAYINGYIDKTAMTFYLGRMYQIKNGERLEMKSPYTADDEINALIRELSLEQRKVLVQKKRKK